MKRIYKCMGKLVNSQKWPETWRTHRCATKYHIYQRDAQKKSQRWPTPIQ